MKARRVFAFALTLLFALSLALQTASAALPPAIEPEEPYRKDTVLPPTTTASQNSTAVLLQQEIALQMGEADQYLTPIDDPQVSEELIASFRNFLDSPQSSQAVGGMQVLSTVIGDALAAPIITEVDFMMFVGDTANNLYLFKTDNSDAALSIVGDFTRVDAEITTGGTDEKRLSGFVYLNADQSVEDISNTQFFVYNGAGGAFGNFGNPWANGDLWFSLVGAGETGPYEQGEKQRRAAQMTTFDGDAYMIRLTYSDLKTISDGWEEKFGSLLSSVDTRLRLLTEERKLVVGEKCDRCGVLLTGENFMDHALRDCVTHCHAQIWNPSTGANYNHTICGGCGEYQCVSNTTHAQECGVHYACLGVKPSIEHRTKCPDCGEYLCACACHTETDADGNCVFCGVAVTAANRVAHAKRGCGAHCQAQVKDADGVTLVHQKCSGCKKFMCVARGHHGLKCGIHYVCLDAKDSADHTTKCPSGEHFLCQGCVCTAQPPAPPKPATCADCGHAAHLPAKCTVSGCVCPEPTLVCAKCGHETHSTYCTVLVQGQPCGCDEF